jgi:hypothetical protein
MLKHGDKAKTAVLTVGDGRGFVVESLSNRVVITAAHCLPRPPCFGRADQYKAMCANVLGPLDQKPTVWAECLFADPIADIAVLGEPDAGSWSKESKAYDELVEPIPPLKSIASLRSIEQVKSALRRNYVTPLRIADAPEEGHAWLLSLEGEWFQCSVTIEHRDVVTRNLIRASTASVTRARKDTVRSPRAPSASLPNRRNRPAQSRQ